MRQTIAALSVLSLLLVAGCQDRDTVRVVPDRQGHALMTTPDTVAATANTRVPREGEAMHTVVAGDTLSSVGKKFNVDIKWLIERNDIIDSKKPLRVGQQLIVPRR
jgi:LysM repeat protein